MSRRQKTLATALGALMAALGAAGFTTYLLDIWLRDERFHQTGNLMLLSGAVVAFVLFGVATFPGGTCDD